MKKVLFAIVAVMFMAMSVSAQSNAWGRKNYFNVSWVDQTLETETDALEAKWDSQFGVALTKGTTYYLHKTPILGILKFGIDWTQIDLNYVKYNELDLGLNDKLEDGFDDDPVGDIIGDYIDDKLGDLHLGRHQAELAMHVGPSLTINPVDHLKINGYFRYAPSFSCVLQETAEGDPRFSYGYGSFFVTGGAISYKVISLGAEYRWGQGKYCTTTFDSDEVDSDLGYGDGKIDVDVNIADAFYKSQQKMCTSSLRVYVSLRF